MTPTFVKPCPTDAISDSAGNLRKLSALRADVSRQSGGNDASRLSCFSSAQAPYPSFPPKTAKTRSFRCFSSSHRTRFAGLRWEPCFVLRRAEDVPENPPESGSKSPPGQGRCPPPKEATQRLTGANTGVLWSHSVLPASVGRGDARRPSPQGAIGVDCAAPVPAPPAATCRAGSRFACVRPSA